MRLMIISPNRETADAICVTTPLDAIMRLEKRPIRTIVLAGAYADDTELAEFLGEQYPNVRIERDPE
jgi:hypothetical protein